MSDQITREELKRQVEAYIQEFPRYKTYADAMRRVLENACEASIPERIVQVRAKSVSSFAEKCVRKFYKYKNPAKDFTDLCGARVIVQTLAQVEAVKVCIELNFQG